MKMAKIYYIGDWAIMLGPVFAETPFNYAYKGTEIYNYGVLLECLDIVLNSRSARVGKGRSG